MTENNNTQTNIRIEESKNIWSKGLEQSCKWIDSRTYEGIDNISGISSNEPLLTNWVEKESIMTYSINFRKHNDYELSALEYEIICRIGASRGITDSQLLRFLLLQGYVISLEKLESMISSLHKAGYINCFVIKDTETGFKSICLSLQRRGYDICRLMNAESGEKEWISKVTIGSEMDFVIRNIIVNQVILNLISNGNTPFLFSRAATYVLRGVKTHHFPLVIGLNGYNYYFEIAKGGDLETKYIRNAFDHLFKSLSSKEPSRFVFICDSPSKMGMLSMYFFKYLKKDIRSRVYYSYTDEWNKDEIGSVYEYITMESMKRQNLFDLK